MKKVSEHLSYAETACHCNHGCLFGLAPGGAHPSMVALFETVRAALSLERGHDCPIEIISWCRCKEHNAEVGGAPHSYHLKGMAVDTLPPDGMTTDEWYDWLDRFVGKAGGVISYIDKNIVHFDCRGTDYRKDGHRGR